MSILAEMSAGPFYGNQSPPYRNPSHIHSFTPAPPPLTAKQSALNNILEKLGKAVDERDNVSIDALSKAYQRINSFN